MHKLLARQLRRHFGSTDALPSELLPFLAAVDQAYHQSDDDRRLLEHSMETVSAELSDRYLRLQDALAESGRAQQELNTTLALLEATIESTTDGLLVVDADGRMVRMNRKFIELWGIPDEILAHRDDKLALAFVVDQLEDPEEFNRKVKELYADPEAASFDTLRFKDQRVYERYSTPQRVDGRTVGRVWSFRDVTARLRLEDQLRQSQKMEAIGSLAGGVAHDFNNLLTVITGHVEFLLEDETLPDSLREDLLQTRHAANRAAGLTNQLLAFARRQIMQPVQLDLNQVVTALRPMLTRLIGEDIDVQVQLDSPLGNVLADRGQLEQVIVNLAVNARDAMPRGGRLDIRTRNVELLEQESAANGSVPPGQWVVLSVHDNGCGMRPEVQDRVFEPFFTTKEAGKGTGLGLATVYGIVTQSGGHVTIASDPGVGSTFLIYLPAVDRVASAEHVATAPTHLPRGNETILLVEDEPAVRRFVMRALEKRGYDVLAADGSAEALAFIAGTGDHIDLLVTDVVMPGMNGPELVARCRVMQPRMPVLYMSGYTDDEILRRGELQPDAAFLQKPFSPAALSQAVLQALGGRSASDASATLEPSTPYAVD